ncbi:discoidin domain-containing receptor 2 [Caerostris extrusa]|uniref:Discoidin domain-containing receptor 2 n=1 Tax=Caerostris extrusa TaxID=172846 RepID=A0AAV4W225_CAEEX|nr:discoidin domain-containing receptor 2 [Caerostris extrusa]
MQVLRRDVGGWYENKPVEVNETFTRESTSRQDFSPSHLNNGSVYGRVAADESDALPLHEPQEMKANYSGAYCNASPSPGSAFGREYAVPDFPRAVTDIQGVSGSTVYAAPHLDERSLPSVPEIPRHRLRPSRSWGRGGSERWVLSSSSAFVFAEPYQAYSIRVVAGSLVPRRGFFGAGGRPLSHPGGREECRAGESTSTREDFFNEVRVLSRLQDPNIVCVLGVCIQGEGPSAWWWSTWRRETCTSTSGNALPRKRPAPHRRKKR